MCGIIGVYLKRQVIPQDLIMIKEMARAINYRGPDEFGLYESDNTILASCRLSIIDQKYGQQPVSNESKQIYAVFNGEIYNYLALRKELIKRGHAFKSYGDTEVIVHLYEEFGDEFVKHLEGQFAIALWDSSKKTLVLTRDQVGICPLYYMETTDGFYFCSEIKGLIASGALKNAINPQALTQIAYFGTVCAPSTMFANVTSLPHANYLKVNSLYAISQWQYWDVDFPMAGEHLKATELEIVDNLQSLIESAVNSRLCAEVTISNFLSGGIDSALIAAASKSYTDFNDKEVMTSYSIASNRDNFDESASASKHGALLGIPLKTLLVTENNIARNFENFIWHSEMPVISTEAVALLLLAKQASYQARVILTGEGADEAFGGYLAFRQFKLIGYLTQNGLSGFRTILRSIFRWIYGTDCLLPKEDRLNELRVQFGCIPAQAYEYEFYYNTLIHVFSDDYRAKMEKGIYWQNLHIDQNQIKGRHWLDQSLYIGYQIMLPNYLLGPHGDRIFAANSVEGRYPFLDRKLIQYSASLAPSLKIKGLNEKYILRKASEKWLPASIAWKKKKRFMMPMLTPFNRENTSPLIMDLLSERLLKEYGYFDPVSVKNLMSAIQNLPPKSSGAKSYLVQLALGLSITFIISTQIWHYQFIAKGAT